MLSQSLAKGSYTKCMQNPQTHKQMRVTTQPSRHSPTSQLQWPAPAAGVLRLQTFLTSASRKLTGASKWFLHSTQRRFGHCVVGSLPLFPTEFRGSGPSLPELSLLREVEMSVLQPVHLVSGRRCCWIVSVAAGRTALEGGGVG